MENAFDHKSKDWDKKQSRRELAAAIAAAIARLPLDDHMLALEFGCGTGLVGLSLAPRLGKLVAVDSSAGMIEVLRHKVEEQGLDNVEWRHGDILSMELPADFDLIFTSMTLHHIDGIEPLLNHLASLLKPGGYLAIADLDHEDGSFHQAGSGEKHHGFEREQLTVMLRARGFDDIRISTVHTIGKRKEDGSIREYPVFLGVAVKR